MSRNILARIKSGDLKPGSRFALNEFARNYGTSSHTVRKAVTLLVEHGFITRTGTDRHRAEHDLDNRGSRWI